jgi:hypothetical protein
MYGRYFLDRKEKLFQKTKAAGKGLPLPRRL